MTLHNLYQHIIREIIDVVGEDEAAGIAYLLLEHFTSHNKISVCLNPNIAIADAVAEQINTAISALQKHTPIQYVLGETTFYGLPFRVDRSVLIPRSETEELVDYVLKDSPHASTVLDICTGSGCIAASLAHYLKEARVYAVDISGEALAVAAENAAWNKADVHFWQKDIFDPDFEKTVEHSFDVIVSNPPYVRQSEKQYMHRRVLNFEPSQALFVEDDKPLLFYHRILKIGQSLLKDRGKLYFEINEAFGKDVFHLFSEYGYSDVVLRKDIHGKDRLLGGKK